MRPYKSAVWSVLEIRSKLMTNPNQTDWVIAPVFDSYIESVQAVDKATSDLSVLIIDSNIVKPHKKVKPLLSRNLKAIDIDKFNLDLQSVLVYDVPNCASSLSSKIQGVVDKHAPLQTRKVSDRVSAPWFNTNIKRAKQHQRKPERRWRKSGLMTDRRLFVTASRDVTHLIQAAKRSFYN